MPTLIQCTKKLLVKVPDRLFDPAMDGERWHANFLRVDRHQCVLFTHDASLYSVFVPGMKKPEFEHLDEVFGQRLFKVMAWDGFPPTHIEVMLDALRVIRCTRSSNRSVLGSMNDLRFHVEVEVGYHGGLANVDMAKLHHRLNRIPMGAIGYQFAVERFHEHIK